MICIIASCLYEPLAWHKILVFSELIQHTPERSSQYTLEGSAAGSWNLFTLWFAAWISSVKRKCLWHYIFQTFLLHRRGPQLCWIKKKNTQGSKFLHRYFNLGHKIGMRKCKDKEMDKQDNLNCHVALPWWGTQLPTTNMVCTSTADTWWREG